MKPQRLLLTFVFITIFSFMSMWVGHKIGTKARIAIAAGAVKIEQSIQQNAIRLKYAHRFAELSKTPLHPTNKPVETFSNPQTNGLINPSIPARQRNLLIIGIDDFRARQPRLISIWMVFYLIDTPHYMLMPIYPTTSSQGFMFPVLDENLASLFQMDKDRSPSSAFMQALQAKDLWWSGYIILDRAALEGIGKFTDGMATKSIQKHLPSLSSIPDPGQNPQEALTGQTRFAQELCRNSAGTPSLDIPEILDLTARLSPHIHTDIDMEQLISEVQATLKNGGGISCEFPSLEIQPVRP
jgi:hypothetical protein